LAFPLYKTTFPDPPPGSVDRGGCCFLREVEDRNLDYWFGWIKETREQFEKAHGNLWF
jgi:hypothetical protein